MVVKLRLFRMGRVKEPHYRVIATDSRNAPQGGRFLEILGSYHPIPHGRTGAKYLRLKGDRVKYWLAVGAQPSDTMARLLAKANFLPEPPIPSVIPKRELIGKWQIHPGIAPKLSTDPQAREKVHLGDVAPFLPLIKLPEPQDPDVPNDLPVNAGRKIPTLYSDMAKYKEEHDAIVLDWVAKHPKKEVQNDPPELVGANRDETADETADDTDAGTTRDDDGEEEEEEEEK